MQPDRQWSLGSYRYGFNGKENDNEVKGEGNQLDFGARIYDPRIGKFLSVDPLTKTYPFYSPYLYAGNSPIRFIDIDGEGPGDALEILLKMLHDAPKVGTKILVEKIAKTNIGKAVGKTTAQVYVSSLGLMNGTNNLLSFGLVNKRFEELGLPEEYRGWYEWATLVGRSQPLPERAVGPGAGNSPRLEFSSGSKPPAVSVPIAQIKPTPNAYVFSNSNEGGSNTSKTSDAAKRENLVNVVNVEDDVMEFSAKIGDETVEGITNFLVKDGKMYLDQLHLQGSSAGNVGRESLWKIAKDLGRQYNVGEVLIQGGKRTTGKYKGQVPSPITIKVD